MYPSRLFFTALKPPLDYLMLLLAAFLTYLIRFESFKTIRPVIYAIPLTEYMQIVFAVAAGWILLFAANGLYRVERLRLMEETGKVIFGCATGFAAVLFYLVFTQELFTSRFILLVAAFLAFIFVMAGRLIIRAAERLALRQGIGSVRLILIGPEPQRSIFRNEFQKKPGLGFRLADEFDRLDPASGAAIRANQKHKKIAGLLLANPQPSREETLEALNLSEDLHLRLLYSADLFAAAAINRTVHTLAGRPVIEVKRTRLDGWGRIAKRLFDVIMAGLLLLLTSPLFLLITLIVLWENGRPLIFRNERIGEGGREFDTLKFRTMYQKYCIGKQFPDHSQALQFEQQLIREQQAQKGPIYKIKQDPRLTPAGRFLRAWSLDELPQLWNVLKGEMSLVGPRPHQVRDVEQYARHHRHLLTVKPGLTGLAQISGRSDLDFEEEVRLDTYYIENWSLALDFYILLKTPLVVLLRRGAY
ncbi:sugar transferase [Candidatus Uhrbacteria bacterium]|nr:sugar transferase [Candidatus Uhrbacteria bacterium]